MAQAAVGGGLLNIDYLLLIIKTEIDIENKVVDIFLKIPFSEWLFKSNSPHGSAQTTRCGKEIIINNYLSVNNHWITIGGINICKINNTKIEKYVNELKNHHRSLILAEMGK